MGFDIDEDRRQLLVEVLGKMIQAIDRCSARMNRIFDATKEEMKLEKEPESMSDPLELSEETTIDEEVKISEDEVFDEMSNTKMEEIGGDFGVGNIQISLEGATEVDYLGVDNQQYQDVMTDEDEIKAFWLFDPGIKFCVDLESDSEAEEIAQEDDAKLIAAAIGDIEACKAQNNVVEEQPIRHVLGTANSRPGLVSYLHQDQVNMVDDIKFCPSSFQKFCSVGDCSCLIPSNAIEMEVQKNLILAPVNTWAARMFDPGIEIKELMSLYENGAIEDMAAKSRKCKMLSASRATLQLVRMGAGCGEEFSLLPDYSLAKLQDMKFSNHIHDSEKIYMDQLRLKFIDTGQFQRWFDLKQLGMTHMVYPEAFHSRFEHSLGIYWLAGEVVHIFKVQQGLELGIDRFDTQNVKVAGLLQDIGHRIFSHFFEHDVLFKVFDGTKWSTVGMSVEMVNYGFYEHIDIDAEAIKRVKEIILAIVKHATEATIPFRYIDANCGVGELGVAASKVELLANHEEREMGHLVAIMIEAQMRKLQFKVKYFEDLELMIEDDNAQLEELEESLIVSLIALCFLRIWKNSHCMSICANAWGCIPDMDFTSILTILFFSGHWTFAYGKNFILLSLCFCILAPLTLLGEHLGTQIEPDRKTWKVSKHISIIDPTGTVGTQTLDIICENPKKFRIVALAAGSNVALLADQLKTFTSKLVSMKDESLVIELQGVLVVAEDKPKIVFGEQGLIEVAHYLGVVIVVTGIDGCVCLKALMVAMEAGKEVKVAYALKHSNCENYNEWVMPSINYLTLKASVARYEASQLITKRKNVMGETQKILTKRAACFNIALDDMSITTLSFGREFTAAIEVKFFAALEYKKGSSHIALAGECSDESYAHGYFDI